ncbi:MAG: hypothetical protein Tsb0034_22660 [Ekhidna sp.]
MKTVSIRISDALEKELKERTKKTGKSQSEIMRTALEKHLLVQKFDDIRDELIPLARKAGYYTEDDIYNDPDIS